MMIFWGYFEEKIGVKTMRRMKKGGDLESDGN